MSRFENFLFYAWWIPTLVLYTIGVICLLSLAFYAFFNLGKFIYDSISKLF